MSGFRMHLLAGTFLALGLPQAALAQHTDIGETEDTIIITAARRDMPAEALPNTVRLIEAGELNTQLLVSTSLLDAVGTQVPSFSPTRQKLSGAGESFRGRSPLYLIDGVPQSNPLRDGSRDGFTLDPAVVERIEVLHGANAIQGVGATGGVINYVTLAPADGVSEWQTRFELGLTAADGIKGDGTGWRAAATALRDFGAVDTVLSIASEARGAFYDADGNRIGVDSIQGDIQDSESVNLFAKIGWDIDPATRLQLTVNHFDLAGDGDYIQVPGDRTNGIPATSVRGRQEGQPPENEVTTVSVDFTRAGLFGGELVTQAFYRDFRAIFGGGVFATFQDPAIDPSGTLFDQSANNSEKYGIKLAWGRDDLLVEGLSMTAGTDWLRDLTYQDLAQTGRNWVPETEFSSIAPFVQFDYVLPGGRARLTAGARQENATLSVDTYETLYSYGAHTVDGGEPDFSETLVNVGGSYDVTDGLTLYASYAEGFTMPDVGRVLRGINTAGQDVDALLDLDPIVADNIEIGGRFEHGPFRLNASYFWSNSDLGQRLSANADGIYEVNRERTEIEGFEISGAWDITSAWTLGGSYAALEGRYDSDDDGSVDRDLGGANISPDRLNLYLEGDLDGGLFLRAQLSHFADRTFDDAGTASDFEGYTQVDLMGGMPLPGRYGRIDIGIQNALNEDYITYYSQTATTANDRYFAGRGRTLTIRWSGEF